jgi:hypothetical protein
MEGIILAYYTPGGYHVNKVSTKSGDNMHTKYIQFVKAKWFIAVACLLLGVVIILGIRFATYKAVAVHYHANFALYINGQRQTFSGAQYYTEAQECTDSNVITPIGRAHMHDNVDNVVHVEDHAVTWGHFFANVGWTMGPTFIASPNGTIYSETTGSKLNLTLNGQSYTDLGGLANTVIRDKDKLLVSYGDESSSVLKQEYSAIPSTAAHYDITKDPVTCSGAAAATLHDRFVNTL